MTPKQLAENVRLFTGSKYFQKETMRFFGDTWSNYGVRSVTIPVGQGQTMEVWELYRKKPVNGGLQTSVYFHKTEYIRVTKVDES